MGVGAVRGRGSGTGRASAQSCRPEVLLGASQRMASKPIVIVGSVNVDLVLRCQRLPLPGETVVGRDFRVLPGGKGANQAVAAARLGPAVEFVGCVCDDPFGAQAAAALRAEGITLTHLHRVVGGATAVAIVLVAEAGQNSI